MDISDRLLELPITVVLIIGGYQFYFWCQRQSFYEARYLPMRWDIAIGFDPRWVWIYSGLYYPMILLVALAQPTWADYARTAGGFLFLLAGQMVFFLRFPVAIPLDWRDNDHVAAARERHPRSMRFLDTVWHYDKLRNSMPSMHVSVATMVDLSISARWPWFGFGGWLFPLLIGISAIKTKQHYLLDVPAGAMMGVAAYVGWQLLWPS